MTDPHIADARTDLRDARLHKALAHAPDYDALPAPSTRDSIKNIAANAAPTRAMAEFATQKPWWKAFWEKTGRAGRGGRASGPWNAAFATLLLGGIITLIWQGQPVPDAVLDERPAVAKGAPDAALPAPAAESAAEPVANPVVKPPVPPAGPAPAPNDLPPASVPVPATTSTTQPQPALAKFPQPGPVSQQRDQAARVASKEAVSRVPASPAAPAPVPAAPAVDLGASAKPALRREAPAFEKRELPAGRAPGGDKSMSDMATAPQQARTQGAAAAPPSPAPAPAPSAAQPAPAAAGAVESVAERIARNDSNNRNRAAMFAPAELQPGEWTSADVLYQGRTTRLARRDAQNLVNRAVALAVANAAPNIAANASANANASAVPKAEGDGAAPLLRLRLVDQGNPATVAQFEVSGNNALRWQRAGRADVAGMITPEAVASLLAEATRAIPP